MTNEEAGEIERLYARIAQLEQEALNSAKREQRIAQLEREGHESQIRQLQRRVDSLLETVQLAEYSAKLLHKDREWGEQKVAELEAELRALRAAHAALAGQLVQLRTGEAPRGPLTLAERRAATVPRYHHQPASPAESAGLWHRGWGSKPAEYPAAPEDFDPDAPIADAPSWPENPHCECGRCIVARAWRTWQTKTNATNARGGIATCAMCGGVGGGHCSECSFHAALERWPLDGGISSGAAQCPARRPAQPTGLIRNPQCTREAAHDGAHYDGHNKVFFGEG